MRSGSKEQNISNEELGVEIEKVLKKDLRLYLLIRRHKLGKIFNEAIEENKLIKQTRV